MSIGTHATGRLSQTSVGAMRGDILELAAEAEEEVSDSDIEEDEAVQSKVRTKYGKKKRKTNAKASTSKKRGSVLEDEHIAAALRPCCPKNCWQRFSFEKVSIERHLFWERNRDEQVDWITRNLVLWGHLDSTMSSFKFKYQIQNAECCAAFFEQALPVSHGRLWAIRKRVLSNNTENFAAMQTNKTSRKQDRVGQFLNSYETEHGNGMPNDRTVQLPAGSTKKDVYIALQESLTQSSSSAGSSVSMSTFYKAWNEKKPDLKCARWHRFSKCSTCSNIKTLQAFYKAGQISGEKTSEKSCPHDFPNPSTHGFLSKSNSCKQYMSNRASQIYRKTFKRSSLDLVSC